MSLPQVWRGILNSQKCFFILCTVGSSSGVSQTSRGGIKDIANRPVEIPIFDERYADGLKFYKDSGLYLRVRSKLDVSIDRFVLEPNAQARYTSQFLKSYRPGLNFFMNIVKSVV